MSFKALVLALGGDLYAGGTRANVPAPGHSADDRSVSLLLRDGRLIIHGFGGADWRDVRRDLQLRGLVDGEGRLTGAAGDSAAATPRPDRRTREAAAAALWARAAPLGVASLSARHLIARGVTRWPDALNLAHHPAAPLSVYGRGRAVRAALVARISDGADRLTAVEITYLDPNGRRSGALRLSRKTVGTVPPGGAVRLAPASAVLLVAEGVVTTLSAMAIFDLPGWALRSAGNLAAWSPPPEVRQVLIAADRGASGETAAARLRDRLHAFGVEAVIRTPAAPFGDWNEALRDPAFLKGKARAERGAGAAGMAPPAGLEPTP